MTIIVSDCRGLPACLATVDALARLALVARREGDELRLWRPSPQLRTLIMQAGLGEVLVEEGEPEAPATP